MMNTVPPAKSRFRKLTLRLTNCDETDYGLAVMEAASMNQKRKNRGRSTRTTLRLPDLDQSKNSVLQSLGSAASKRTYGAAIEDFISWYCSEPRLGFNRSVVVRYRSFLESLSLSAATINLHLSAIRRLADEAAESGWLSSELAIRLKNY